MFNDICLIVKSSFKMKSTQWGESWQMENDGEWRTMQYLANWVHVKVIKCFLPRMLSPPMGRVNTNKMELLYHSLS